MLISFSSISTNIFLALGANPGRLYPVDLTFNLLPNTISKSDSCTMVLEVSWPKIPILPA